MRQYVRHPSDIPVDLHVINGHRDSRHAQMHDVSIAGLSCRVAAPVAEGAYVELNVPSITDACLGRGTVAWCRPCRGCFKVGVQFLDEQDAYRARMVEQLCQIEAYRRQMEASEGRFMDGEAAAAEWIERYAAEFGERFDHRGGDFN